MSLLTCDVSLQEWVQLTRWSVTTHTHTHTHSHTHTHTHTLRLGLTCDVSLQEWARLTRWSVTTLTRMSGSRRPVFSLVGAPRARAPSADCPMCATTRFTAKLRVLTHHVLKTIFKYMKICEKNTRLKRCFRAILCRRFIVSYEFVLDVHFRRRYGSFD